MNGPSKDNVAVRTHEHWRGWLWLYFALTAAGVALAIYEGVPK